MKAFRWLAEIISVMLLGLFLSWLLMPGPKQCPCPNPCPCPPPAPKVGPAPAPLDEPNPERRPRKRKKPQTAMPLLEEEEACP